MSSLQETHEKSKKDKELSEFTGSPRVMNQNASQDNILSKNDKVFMTA